MLSPAPAPQQPSYAPQPSYNSQMGSSFGAPAQPQKGPGFGIASMVCGIVALVLSCCIPWVPVILGLVGLVLGAVGLRGNRRGKGMAIAGLVTSIIALVPAVLLVLGVMGTSSLISSMM